MEMLTVGFCHIQGGELLVCCNLALLRQVLTLEFNHDKMEKLLNFY